jgi:hypothetical protein
MLARKVAAFGLALTLGLAGTALIAQEEGGEDSGLNPADLFKSAKEAYDGKKYGKALQELNLLVGAVGKMRVKQLKAALPDAPAGWTAEDAKGEGYAPGFIATGISVKRRYTKGENTNVELELVSDSPMVGMIAPMLTNPAFFQGQENTQLVTYKGKRAILEFNKESKSGSIKMLLSNNSTLLTLTGNEVAKADLEAFGKGIDYDKLEKALQE